MNEFSASPAAEAIWLRHLSRRVGGQAVDLEQLRAAHPHLAHEFERLEQDWARGSRGGAIDALPSQVRDARLESVLERLARARPAAARYEVRDEIGRGGMGVVRRVWDATLKRELAMKTVHSSFGFARERALARFVEEAQILAQLDHPAIVPIHDLALDEHGRPYFVMKLVVGRDLAAVFSLAGEQQEGWTAPRALDVLLRVCEAVGYAHRKGVVHRDLKPSNVMVGELGEVYVMDWGIARVLQDGRAAALDTLRSEAPASDAADSLHTSEGDIVGTVAYMAPEQARSEQASVTPRSDVYSFGAMLYELLSGSRPYANAGNSNRQMLLALLAGPPPPLGLAAPGTPDELAAICAKAMARDAAQRYADMADVAVDLRAFLEGRVVRAHSTGRWTKLTKWVRRNRALSGAVGVALVVSLAGGAASWLQAQAARRQLRDFELLATQDALDALASQAAEAQPPRPELLGVYDRWLEDLRGHVEGRAADVARGITASAGLEAHLAALAELRNGARPLTPEELERDRRSHPLWDQLESKRAELAWRNRLLGVDPWPDEAEVRRELASQLALTDADELTRLARERIGSDFRRFGEEVHALVLAERAVELAVGDQRGPAYGHLWLALTKLGRWDEALAAARTADALGGATDLFDLGVVEADLERARQPAEQLRRRDVAAAAVAALASEVSVRRTYEYDSPSLSSWDARIVRLTDTLRSMAESELAFDGTEDPVRADWTIAARRARVLRIYEESIHGAEAVARWSEALESIRASALYDGLEISPQFGLLPLGIDPHSGLWEFAHLFSGEPARRGVDGRLELGPDTAIVLVLVPGGRFYMGAQSADPDARNYDPEADRDEAPVHEVALSPFFVAKHEMTVAQWRRLGETDAVRRSSDPLADLLPVDSVSWRRCQELLPRVGLLLPTEAQWEYVCRAGVTTPFCIEPEGQDVCGAGNLYEGSAWEAGIGSSSPNEDWIDGFGSAAPVGSFPANRFGLHDVIGNVNEWCREAFGSYLTPVRAGDGQRDAESESHRILRGGSYASNAWQARSACRISTSPDYAHAETGLRPARALDP